MHREREKETERKRRVGIGRKMRISMALFRVSSRVIFRLYEDL